MEDIIKRVIEHTYPELKAGHHLPRTAQVVKVREPVTEGDVIDPFRPKYAVSVQILDVHGEPDPAFPVLHDVPISAPTAGNESGRFAYPPEGSRVEVAFANGSPNNPFIRGTLPHGLSMPAIQPGEILDQHSPGSFQRVDKDGNRFTETDGTLSEKALTRLVEAVECIEQFTTKEVTIDAELIETVGAARVMKAMGLMQMLSGGRLDIGAVGDLNISSNSQNLLKAPLTWVGSDSENLLGLVSELIAQVKSLCDTLASHDHPDAGTINQGAAVNSVGSAVDAIKGRLDAIKA